MKNTLLSFSSSRQICTQPIQTQGNSFNNFAFMLALLLLNIQYVNYKSKENYTIAWKIKGLGATTAQVFINKSPSSLWNVLCLLLIHLDVWASLFRKMYSMCMRFLHLKAVLTFICWPGGGSSSVLTLNQTSMYKQDVVTSQLVVARRQYVT